MMIHYKKNPCIPTIRQYLELVIVQESIAVGDAQKEPGQALSQYCKLRSG